MLNTPVLFLETADPNNSKTFYESILGFTFISEDQFALVFEVGDTELRIQKVETVSNQGYTALGWAVSDIKTVVEKLTQKGVSFELYEQLAQDNLGIWNSPNARVAWFKDPDGNHLSITRYSN